MNSHLNLRILTAQLKFEEGFRATKYKCPSGFWTIGYGRNLDVNPLYKGVRIPSRVTPELAAEILNSDVNVCINQVASEIPFFMSLSGPVQASLINMSFQMGVQGLLKFKNTLRLLGEGKREEAAEGILDSLYAKQTPGRARRVSDQIRNNTYYKLER